MKDILSYLCVLNNPLDDLRLRRIINVPARGIGNTTIEKLTVVAAQQQLSLYETIRNADLFPELKSAAAKLLKFADLIDSLCAAGGRLALPEFYDQVLDRHRLRPGPGGEERHGEPGPHRERPGAEVQHPGLPGRGAGGPHPLGLPQ